MSKMKKVLIALLRGGMSQSAIAAAEHVSKRDVSEAARVAKERGLTLAEVESMDAAKVDSELFPRAERPRDASHLQPDLAALVERKKKNSKLPVKLLWMEHCEQAAAEGKLAYSYQAFCEMFAQEAEESGAARRFRHAPGEKAFVDWAGLTAWLTDKVTGHRTKVYVLVIVLPCSAYFWAGGFTDMRQRSWLEGHMQAFEGFGGTPRMLIPDNCATATDRGQAHATLVNEEYQRFAEHYGCAVIPTRVRAPRDKGLAESTVNLVEEWVIAPSNEMRFYTLGEFNEYCAERIAWLNSRPFSDREGSRESEFESEERAALQPLPPERYETCEWRRCKVAPNYHVRVDYMHYSVPHTLIGRTVDVRVTESAVTVLDGGEVVARHDRLRGRRGQYSTIAEHMPANHRELDSPWSRERFESWAEKVGPETATAVKRLLDRSAIVEQAFVPCRNILGLAKRYGPERLERACARVNEAGAVPSYTGLKNSVLAAKAAEANGRPRTVAEPSQVVDRAKSAGRVRGAEAYRRNRPEGGAGDAD